MQQRLNNLFLLYVHTARTDALDLSSMVKAFVSANIHDPIILGSFRTSELLSWL